MRFDWRRVLIYTHRWLGIAGCVVFFVWFVSGVVMMYERMPRLTAAERLARLATLDPSRVTVALAEAAPVAAAPERVRVGMLGERPVYRFLAEGAWTTVYADDGRPLGDVSADQAIAILRSFFPEHAATMRDAGRLEQPDQWTLDGGLPRFLPMRRIAMGDADGTYVYVSEHTGEAVMRTTARGRFWGYVGSVLHWTYFTPFRQRRELWRYTIIYAALVGCVMCLSGLVIGVWRFSPSARFRLKRVHSHSPYAGLMWWHHYAGLLFGLFSFTWALSGALSLTPWDWTPSTAPTEPQRLAVSGGELDLGAISLEALNTAFARMAREIPVKELEVMQFQGRPFALGFRAPPLEEARRSNNPDVSAIFSVHVPLDRRIAWLDDPESMTFARFPRNVIAQAGRAAVAGERLQDQAWLARHDSYYYDRWEAKPLPVLRVRFADPDETWLYLDPGNGLISLRHTTRSRWNRWLYNGLHSLDFPFLYDRRPAWDLVVIALSVGGIAVTVTTMLPAWRRMRRNLR